MKYNIGDRIKIDKNKNYTFKGRKALMELDPPFVLTIKKTDGNGYYYVEENDNCWWRWHIEGLYEDPDPIKTRFEILDL